MFKNIGSNWARNVLSIVVLMHLTPFVIDELGADVNGVWVTIVSSTLILKLLILGVPMATVRYLAAAVARKDTAAANRALSTCLAMCVALGAGAALVGAFLYFGFERVLLESDRFDNLSPEVLESARLAFIVLVGQVAIGFAARLPYGLFDAHHDFVPRNVVMLGELAMRYVLTLILLSYEASLVLLASVQVASMLTEFGVALYLTRRRYPELVFSLRAFDRTLIRGVLSFSIFAMLLNLGALFAFRIDALVVGANIGPTAVTHYDIGNKFWEPLTEFLIGIGVVVMPRATQLSTQGKDADLRALFLQWSKIALSLVLCVTLYLIVLGPEFLAWWVGPQFQGDAGLVLQVIMASAIVFLPARGVALPILMGLGKPKAPALAFLAMSLTNLGLSLALVDRLGLLGVALGTALPNLAFAAYVVLLCARELDVRPGEWLSYVGGRILIGALAPLACLLALKHGVGIAGLTELLLAGIASVAVFGAVWILFVFKGDPHFDPYARIAAKLRSRAA